MITTFILNLIYYAVSAILSPLLLLPDASFPSNVVSAIASASSYISILNVILPADTLMTIVGAFLAVEVAIFTYKLIKWVYNKIPGVN
jgi:hypothetical protein